uniref:Uncharacterized protein n=1 Tax=Erpetoichthys calabaricus TaxID=27687 RepID=A0A8C4TKM7_ERPCA
MASARPSRLVDQYTCAVCLCVIENPITILCGHSYCMKCINDYCDRSYREGVYRCPQCRRTFNSRPEFRRNSTLMDLLENFSYAGPDDVPCDVCIGRKRKASKTCLTCMASFCESHLQQHRESQVLKRHQRAEKQVRSGDVSFLKHFLSFLAKTEEHTLRHPEVLAHFYLFSGCTAREAKTEVIEIYQSGKGYKAISKALGLQRTTVRAIIHKWQKHGTVVNLPRSGRPTKITPRAQRRLIREVTKDPRTTSKELQASLASIKVNKGTVTLCRDHPDRFRFQPQVLCREALSGTRCYWEVEWIGIWADIGVAYKGIERRGWNEECHLGHNDKSWCLCCSPSRYFVRHNKMESQICTPSSNRIGVYLDCPAGSLSFYSISDTMTLLFNMSFTELLYPGFGCVPAGIIQLTLFMIFRSNALTCHPASIINWPAMDHVYPTQARHASFFPFLWKLLDLRHFYSKTHFFF